MKKMTKKQKAAMLASLMGGCMISSNVLAANLIAGVPSDYGTSQLGAVTGSYVTTAVDQDPAAGVVTELNRDPSVFNVMVNGKSMVFLRQYTYSTTALKGSQLFPSEGDWEGDAISGTVEKAPNAHAAAAYGNYIYVADYDFGNIGVARIGSDSLIEDTSKAISLKDDIVNKCGGTFENENAWVHGEGLLVKDNYLYVMVNVNPEGSWETYEPSYLIQYKIGVDGSLEYVNHTRVGKNTDVATLNLYNNMIVTSGIGGMQNYGNTIGGGTVPGEGGTIGNEDTSVDISFINANTLNSESQKVIVPESVKERGLDFRGIKVLPNGTAYVLTYNLSGSGGGSTMYVYKTTMSNLLTENPQDWEVVIKKDVAGGTEEDNGAGWFNKIDAEYYTKRVWAEIGDSLVVYTDGSATPTYTWQTKDFSTNEQLYKWNSVITLKPDMVTGDLALLTESSMEGLTAPSTTVVKVVNQNATNLKGDYLFGISGTESDSVYSGVTNDYSNYLFDSDKVISLPLLREGDLNNNVLAAIYAHSGNDINVNSGDHTLQLQTKNYIANPVGIYAGNGKDVTVTAGKLNIIAAGYEGGNTLTNAIWNDAGENTASTITINAPVNISMNGGYGGNGIAVQKTDRWGEASYTANTASEIIINGDVSIKGADSETWGIPINAENVFSRFNNAGILTSVEKSKVTINGNVDFNIYGNGITTNAADSVVTIGGGQITVPTGMNYGYYTLASYLGTINVNTGENGTTAGTQDVQLNGDIFALETGNINLALTTDESYLNGIVDNGGKVNLWLQNGAVWTNEANNTRYIQDNEDVGYGEKSHITNFCGGSNQAAAGVIYQTVNSDILTIDNYSGYATVLYEHDAQTPANILGGDVKIAKAAQSSNIVIRTDYDNNMSTESVQNDVLNALANKLYYNAYTTGENNLTGTVQIAEGLTAAAASKYVGDIAFDAATGQGSLKGTAEPAPDPDPTPTPDPDEPEPEDPNNEKDNVTINKTNETWIGYNSGDNVTVNLTQNANWINNNTGDSLQLTAQDSAWSGNNSGDDATVTLTGSTWSGANEGANTTVTMDSTSQWTNSNTGAGLTLTANGGTWNGTNSGSSAEINLNGGTWTGANSGSNADVTMTNQASWTKDNTGDSLKLTMTNASWSGENKGANAEIILSEDANWTGSNSGTGSVTVDGGAWSGDNTSTAEVTVNDGTWTGVNSANGSVAIAGGTWSGNNAGTATITGGTWNGNNAGTATVNSTWNGDNSGEATVDADWTGANSGTATLNGGTWTGDNTANGTATIAGGTWSGDNTSTAEVTVNDGTWTGENSANGSVAIAGGTWSGSNAAAGTVNLTDGVWKGSNNGTGSVTIDSGTWSGDNTSAAEVTMNGGTWTGINSGADAVITMNDGAVWTADNTGVNATVKLNKGAAWTGNNIGAEAAINVADTTWNGTNEAADTQIILTDGAVWGGNNSGNDLNLTAQNSSWSGNNSGNGAEIDLNSSIWNGCNTGTNVTVELDSTTWTGYSNADGFSLTLNDSVWKNNGRSQAAKFAADNGVIDMTAANAGDITIADYSGKTIVLYSHDASDAAKVNGGNITIEKAAANSSITLRTDASGIDMNADDSIESALNAMANKLYYTAFTSGETNLSGYVEIAEGLTSTSVSKYLDNITYDAATGQGSYEIPRDNNEKDNVVINKMGEVWNGYNSGKNVTVNITENGTWSGNNAAAADGVNVTLTDGTWSGDNQGTNTVVNGTDGTWAGDNTGSVTLNSGTWTGGNTADGTATITDGTWNGDNAGTATVNSTWNGDNSGEATVDADWTGANTGTATLNGGTWTGDNEADGTATITSGTWSGDNAGTATVNSTWNGDNSGTAEITLNENTWSGDNYNKVTITGGKWTGDNSGKNSSATLSGTEWSGDNIAEKAAVTLGGSAIWSGDNIGGKAKVVLGDSTTVNLFALNDAITIWSGNNLSDDEFDITVGSNSEWSGYNSGDNAAVTINGGTWSGDNTDAADGVNVTLTDGTWSGDNQGTNTVVNGTDGTWTGDNIGSVTLNSGTWTGSNTAEGTATIAGGIWKGDNAGTATVNSTWNGDNSGEATVDADWTGANSGTATLNGSTWTGDNTVDGTATITDGTWNGDNAGNATVKGTWNGNNSGTAEITLGESTWSGNNSGSVTITGGKWSGSNSGANTKVTLTDTEWSGNDSSDTADITLNSSTWTGYSAADNLDLTLSSSTWYNINSTATASRINDLGATSGIIDMTASSQDLNIDNYSGNAVIIYKHDISTPTDIIGGTTTIKNAQTGAEITLRTDRNGLNLESDVYTDKNLVNATLNALANKLYYSAYTSGERNLSGQVEIAEGLTAAAVSKRLENISFNESTGQGQYEYEKAYPDQQIKSTIETGIDGSEEAETVYKEAGILKADGSYQFTSDPTEIKADNTITTSEENLTVIAQGTLKLTADQTAITAAGGQTAEVSAEELIISGQTGIKAVSGSVIINGDTNITAANGIEAVSGGSVELNDTAAITSSDTAISADGEGSSVTIADGTITGDIEAANGASVTINRTASQAKVVIDGDINVDDSSSVELNLGSDSSRFVGNLNGNGQADITLGSEATWTGAYTGNALTFNLNSGAVWRNTNTNDTVVDTVNGAAAAMSRAASTLGTIDMTADNVGNLTINNYNGSAMVIYKHDAATPTDILGGDTIIKQAAAGSSITLSTDNSGIQMRDEEQVKGVLNNLANKLFYEESVQNLNNLTGKVQIAEGLVSSSASLAFGSMTYDTANNGQGNLVADSMTIINRDPDIIYGDSETAMMRGAKSAMASTAMMWRSENSDLMQRMGDLRLNSSDSGAWVKYYSGKYEMDAQKTSFATDYTAYQLGYDKQVGNGWLVGTAVSYSDGESSYNLGGRGDNTVLSLSVYGTWNHQDGRYADIILKGSHLNNEYTVYNAMMHKLEGDYSTWGTSVSAQYGKYIERKNGFYIDPSVQLTVGRIQGKDYSAHSDFLDSKGKNKDMLVSQNSFDSMIARLGIGIGKRNVKSNYYMRLALAHEFAGDFSAQYAAENEPTSGTSIDFSDTWYELQIGGTTRLSDNSLLYLSYERDFGGDVTQKWRVDAGFRFSF